MRGRIAKYRRAAPNDRSAFPVGCRILTQPFFLPERRWIPVPETWSANIVSFKGYSINETDGLYTLERRSDRSDGQAFVWIG
jgi:putative restriction endonuclease